MTLTSIPRPFLCPAPHALTRGPVIAPAMRLAMTLAWALSLCACSSAPSRLDAAAPLPTTAWVQAAADGQWSVRAIGNGALCPVLQGPQGPLNLRQRAAPVLVPARTGGAQPDAKATAFADSTCEAAWPAGASSVRVGAQVLQAPAAEVRRIVVIGDTGCRMKQSENAFQACNDGVQWPFAQVARAAAAKQPDLVIHVGDIHYRESPCPAGKPGCAGSPWGYGADAWRADFFEPAAPLLAAAPWLFVRGNHESCSRAGIGWFHYLDAAPWAAARACLDPAQDAEGDFSAPWAWPVSSQLQFIVFDSSFAGGKPYPEGSPVAAVYSAQLARVGALAAAAPHNHFLNHHPVLGFGSSVSGEPKPGTASLLSVMSKTAPKRLYPEGVDVVLNGHVHLFQALGFAGPYPATLVAGNSGSAMEGTVNPVAALHAQPAPGAAVQTFATQPGFGFATLDRIGAPEQAAWLLTEWSVDGQPLARCRLTGSRLRCE